MPASCTNDSILYQQNRCVFRMLDNGSNPLRIGQTRRRCAVNSSSAPFTANDRCSLLERVTNCGLSLPCFVICSLQAIPSRCNVFQKSGHSGCAKNGAIVHRTPYGFILTHLVEPVNKQFNGFSILHKTVEIILDRLLLESGKRCGKRKKKPYDSSLSAGHHTVSRSIER